MATETKHTEQPTDVKPTETPASTPPQYPEDLKAILEQHTAKIVELESQRTALAADVAAKDKSLSDLRAQVIDLTKKAETPKVAAPSETDIAALASRLVEEKMSEITAQMAAKDQRLQQMEAELSLTRVSAARERLVRDAKGEIVEGMLDGAKTVEELQERGVLAKKAYADIAAAVRAKMSSTVPPDPNAGHSTTDETPRDSVTPKKLVSDEINEFIAKNGNNPLTYSVDARTAWANLKVRAREEAGL